MSPIVCAGIAYGQANVGTASVVVTRAALTWESTRLAGDSAFEFRAKIARHSLRALRRGILRPKSVPVVSSAVGSVVAGPTLQDSCATTVRSEATCWARCLMHRDKFLRVETVVFAANSAVVMLSPTWCENAANVVALPFMTHGAEGVPRHSFEHQVRHSPTSARSSRAAFKTTDRRPRALPHRLFRWSRLAPRPRQIGVQNVELVRRAGGDRACASV